MAVSDHHGDEHLPPWRPQYNTPSPREGFCRVTTSRRDLAAHVIVFGEIRAACLTFKAQQAGCECEALVDVIDLYPFTYYQSRSLTLRGHHQARYLKFVSSSTRDGFNSTPASIKKKKKKKRYLEPGSQYVVPRTRSGGGAVGQPATLSKSMPQSLAGNWCSGVAAFDTWSLSDAHGDSNENPDPDDTYGFEENSLSDSDRTADAARDNVGMSDTF